MGEPTNGTSGNNGSYTLQPKRGRSGWGKRLLIAGGLLVALVGARVAEVEWQTKRAKEAYVAARDALRQAGEPAGPEDLGGRYAVADEQNAAVPLRRPAGRLPMFDRAVSDEMFKYSFVVPLSPRERELVATRLTTIDAVEADVREAAARPGADWKVPFARPMLQSLYPDLTAQREVATTLDYAATRAMDGGDAAGALSRAGLTLTCGRAMRHHPTALGFLDSCGLDAVAFARIEDTSARMRVAVADDVKAAATTAGYVEVGDADAAKSKAVNPAVVRDVMAKLADESGLAEALGDAFRSDRAQAVESMVMIATWQMPVVDSNDLQERASIYLARPHYWNAATSIIDRTNVALRAAAAAPNFPSTAAGLPAARDPSSARDVGERILNLMAPSYVQIAGHHYDMIARRRLARAALAVHLYAADHGGHRPASLDELVPGYLPSVPRDPMSVAGRQPILYVPDGADPRLYSIGRNGVDDGGKDPDRIAASRSVLSGKGSVTDTGDILFRLNPQPRPPMPRPEEGEATP